MKHLKKKDKQGVNRIIGAFTWGFLLIFSWFVFNVLFFNSNDLVHFRMIRSFFIGIGILLVLLTGYFIISNYKMNWFRRNQKVIFILGLLIVFVLQILVAKSIYFNPGWDVGGVIDHGINLVSSPENFDYSYFMLYPNNIFLMLINSIVYRVSLTFGFIDYRFTLVLINIIIVDLSIIFSMLISKKIFSKKSSVITLSCFLLLFAFSPWIVIPYSDTLSMLFPILIFYIFLLQKDITGKVKKGILIFLIGVFGVIGFQIKPTSIIVIIAILIAETIYSIKEKRKILNYIVFTMLIIIGFTSTKIIYNNITSNIVVNGHNLDDRENIEVPFTHFMMMGMQSVYVENRGSIYGAYNEDDINLTISKPTKEAKIETNIEEIKKRLSNFGLKGYLRFLNNKACWVLSDGTFYYGGEGNFMRGEPYSNSEMSKKLQGIFLHTGSNFYTFANILEGFWILILLLSIYPVFIRRKDKDESLFIIRMTITGIVLFLLFFEGRSRYLINHIPFFILLATYGFEKAYERYLEITKV